MHNNMDQKEIIAEILDYIDNVRNDILKMVSRCDEKILNYKPKPEKWSILEILQHLSKMEIIFYLTIKNALSQNPLEKVPDTKYRIDGFTRKFLLDKKNKLKTPQAAEPKGNVLYNNIIEELKKNRENLKELIRSISGKNLFKQCTSHPYGEGKFVNVFQWIDLLGTHEEKHKKQIEEIIQSYNLNN